MKIRAKLLQVKNKTLQLRVYNQLPFYLCKLIYELDGTEDNKYVQFLMEMTKHFLRIKGYYKQYPLEDKASESVIKDGLHKLGYTILDNNA